MYKCEKCFGSEVEYLDWIDLNTGEPQGDGLEEFYCRTCGAHTSVVFENLDGDIIDITSNKPIKDEE